MVHSCGVLPSSSPRKQRSILLGTQLRQGETIPKLVGRFYQMTSYISRRFDVCEIDEFVIHLMHRVQSRACVKVGGSERLGCIKKSFLGDADADVG